MFGSSKKSETFKYEVEVNSLIREATAGLNQRVLALEITNQQLIQHNQKLEYELQTLKQTLYTDIQRLEKRITDFTDLWHPIMTENMNRIKAELEETIRQTDREDIQKVSFDLENKLTKLLDEQNNDILIGYRPESSGGQIVPIVVNKECDWNKLQGQIRTCYGNYFGCSIYIHKLNKLTNIKYFDIHQLQGLRIVDNNDNIIIEVNPSNNCDMLSWTTCYTNKDKIKNLYKLCKEYGIKFVINGQDRINGVPLKMLFEDE